MPLSSYSSQAVSISANTQPIYPKTIIDWAVALKSEVCPMIVTTQLPQLVGNGGQNGGLIHGIEVQSLGDNSETNLYLYTQALNSTGYTTNPSLNLSYFPLLRVNISASDESTNIAVPLFPILPNGNTAYHLAAGATLYAALSNEVETGLVVRVRGGLY